jgi:hypothetical protein
VGDNLGGTERLLLAQQARLDDDAHKAEELRIALLVRAVVTETVKEHSLTSEEREWVRLAIKREARIESFRSAVIEKTLAGLVWAALVGIGLAAWEYVKFKTGAPRA